MTRCPSQLLLHWPPTGCSSQALLQHGFPRGHSCYQTDCCCRAPQAAASFRSHPPVPAWAPPPQAAGTDSLFLCCPLCATCEQSASPWSSATDSLLWQWRTSPPSPTLASMRVSPTFSHSHNCYTALQPFNCYPGCTTNISHQAQL